MSDAVVMVNVDKSYGTTKALDRFDLTVTRGEVMGFLGPNGAGKSTAIRVLMGLIRHDGGQVGMLDGDPWRDAVDLHRRVAYVPGDVELWPTLTGGEAIDLLGGLGSGVDPGRRSELIDRFEFDPTKKCRSYSKGNRQKVALIAALSGSAELVVLDEPTSGLDPLMESMFQQEIRSLVDDGRTVLLSSHILAEVESLCDRVTIIRDGHTVEAGSLASLRHLTRTSVDVTTGSPLGGLSAMAGVTDFAPVGERRARFSVENADLGPVMAELGKLGIESLVSQPPTLEDVFMRHYGADS